MKKQNSLLKAQKVKDGTKPAISLNPVLSAAASTELPTKHKKRKQKFLRMASVGKKYCVGFPKMVAVPYTGQKEPIVVGSQEYVEKWLKEFWESIYGKKN